MRNNNSEIDCSKDQTQALRLIYPQWQGGDIVSWIPNIPANEVSRGYYLGSQLLNFLAPNSNQKTVEVPISLNIENRKSENGI